MPIWALASAMLRSAAAISGRRSSNCEGNPIGMGGGDVVIGLTGMENPEAGLPTSVAIACSNSARAIPTLILCACTVSRVVWACTTESMLSTPV